MSAIVLVSWNVSFDEAFEKLKTIVQIFTKRFFSNNNSVNIF